MGWFSRVCAQPTTNPTKLGGGSSNPPLTDKRVKLASESGQVVHGGKIRQNGFFQAKIR